MKANDLIKGKWYKRNYYGTNTMYFLFREIIGNHIYAGMNPDIEEVYITADDTNTKISVWKLYYSSVLISNTRESDYEEVDYCDIMKMIPDNHPMKKIYIRKQKIKSLLGIWK